MHSPTTPRRSVLAVGATVLAKALAGCLGGGPGQATASPILGTRFDGPDLVVELRDGHEVSRLNLIGPDGELFASTAVAVGTTAARLELLDIQPEPRLRHYTPGGHRLVAVVDDEEYELELDLRPELRVVGVEQYRDGDTPADLGRLAVTVENVGTGPTWVYDITYVGAPNRTADDELGDDPGLVVLNSPSEKDKTIIGPGTRKSYTGDTRPLLFRPENGTICSGSTEFSVIIGIASGRSLRVVVLIDVEGEATSASITGEYVCSKVQFEMVGGDSNV